jgi:hypothetical protein
MEQQKDLFFDRQSQAFGQETQERITQTEIVFEECN